MTVLESFGTIEELTTWWDDKCCNNCKVENLGDHLVVRVFPNVLRCPYKDGFHAVQLINKARNSRADPTHLSTFAKEIGGYLRLRYEPDVEEVSTYIKRQYPKLSEMDQSEKAKSKAYESNIRRYPAPQKDAQSDLLSLVTRWEEFDKTVTHGVVKTTSKFGGIGTRDQIQLVCNCIAKGCLSEGVPSTVSIDARVEQMYTKLSVGPKTGLTKNKYKGGTAKNENKYGTMNRLFTHEGGGHRNPKLSHRLVSLAVYEGNQRQDTTLGRLESYAIGTLWSRILLNVQVGDGRVTDGRAFSKTGMRATPKSRDEPQGWDY